MACLKYAEKMGWDGGRGGRSSSCTPEMSNARDRCPKGARLKKFVVYVLRSNSRGQFAVVLWYSLRVIAPDEDGPDDSAAITDGRTNAVVFRGVDSGGGGKTIGQFLPPPPVDYR